MEFGWRVGVLGANPGRALRLANQPYLPNIDLHAKKGSSKMSNFLERWNDTGIRVNESWDPEQYEKEQRTRLACLNIMAAHAEQVPRRLTDATSEELSMDKLLSRKIKTRAISSLLNWNAGSDEVSETPTAKQIEELQKEGAQVIWPMWWENHKAYIEKELRVVATTCIKLGETKIGNRFANRLLNELNIFGQLF